MPRTDILDYILFYISSPCFASYRIKQLTFCVFDVFLSIELLMMFTSVNTDLNFS